MSGNLTPKSVTNFFGNRKTTEPAAQSSTNQASAKCREHPRSSFDFFNQNNLNSVQHDSAACVPTPSTAYEPLDSSLPNAETTFDFSTHNYSSSNAHVNVGVQYQARIPAFNPNREDAKLRSDRADRLWCPSILDRLTYSNDDETRKCKAIMSSKRRTSLLKEFDLYIELSSRLVFGDSFSALESFFLKVSICELTSFSSLSSCIRGNGSNREYAYHLLYQNNGDLSKSIM